MRGSRRNHHSDRLHWGELHFNALGLFAQRNSPSVIFEFEPVRKTKHTLYIFYVYFFGMGEVFPFAHNL
jgi:hypothetical protein